MESKEKLVIPKIENIHQKIYEAANKKDALNMSNWHTCNTTHCRAGWAVHLAGKEGYALEEFYGGNTLVTAMRIIHESSHIEVGCPHFFESNDQALAHMKKCAEEESKLNPNGKSKNE